MKKFFELLPIRDVSLHGIEPGMSKKSSYTYNSPRDILTRFLNDPTVFSQYLSSGLDKHFSCVQ